MNNNNSLFKCGWLMKLSFSNYFIRNKREKSYTQLNKNIVSSV